MKKTKLFTVLLISLFCLSFLTIFPVQFVNAAEMIRIQGNCKGTGTSSTSPFQVNVTMDSTPTEGNLLIATVVSKHEIGNVPMSIGSINETGVTWSKQVSKSFSSPALDCEIWAGVIGSGASTAVNVTVTGDAYSTAFHVVVDICEYSNVATTDFLDKSNSTTGSGSQNIVTGTTATTSTAKQLWIGAIASDAGTNQTSPTNSFSLLDGTLYNSVISNSYLEKIVSSAGEASSGTTTSGYGASYAGCIATFFSAETSPPSFYSISTDTATNGSSCTFSSYCQADAVRSATLSGYIFGSNASGPWTNQTWTAFSGSPSEAWANATETLPISVGDVVQYEWWANDSANTWGNSGIQSMWTMGYYQVSESKIISTIVAGIDANQAIRHQEKSFYAVGRFWAFYMDNSTGTNYGYYTSSSDAINWADPVCLNVSSGEHTGENIQVLLDLSGAIHLFFREGTTLYYGSATPNSSGSLTWITSLQSAISLSVGNTDFCAALDADGYPWVIWAWGTSLPTQTVFAYKSAYNNGTWSLASGFPISVVGPGYWSNNMIIPLSNGDMYFLYYKAGYNSIYGKLYNGTLGSQETCSETAMIVDYAFALESWNRAWTVDDNDNIFLSFLNTDNELVIMARNSATKTWSPEAVVQVGVVDGASPSLNWLNNLLTLFWIHNETCIASEGVENGFPDSGTLSYASITGTIPLSATPSDGPGFLNAFTANFNGKPALLYVTNATLSDFGYDYQINLGLFDFVTYTITTSISSAGSGTISPESATGLQGFSQDFTVTPNSGSNINIVQIDSGDNIANNTNGMTIHFTNIQAN